MRCHVPRGDDGVMNDTQQAPPPQPPPSEPGPHDEFDPHRLRTITDMRRSSDDRMVAGVCAGAARYLNVDPVVVRVVIAVLALAGLSGVIVYVAAWLLLPADSADRSLVADWFSLDRNEPQVRVGGLVAAVVLAALSAAGDTSWAWWGDTAWWLIPLAVVFYLFWVRPRRRGHTVVPTPQDERSVPVDAATTEPTVQMPRPAAAPAPARARPRRSPALLALTTSVTAIALAATWIYDETQDDVHWTAYVAAALAVVAVGVLVGTVVGDAGLLIVVGVLLTATLAVSSVFPSGRIGLQSPAPTAAAEVRTHYRHGVGELDLDLTRVVDVQQLAGRTIHIDAGIGQTTVYVPEGLNVAVDADVQAGQLDILGARDDGTGVSLDVGPVRPAEPALTIDIDQKLGQIEVISR
jgi:phage shock protein PspC (stress-responsive transcriptional regulator)